jgi:abhydrolase domain-containing protein 12
MGLSAAMGASLSFLSGIWVPATFLCCVPWVQKRECLPAGAPDIS